MKTTSSKIALIILSVISLTSEAANTIDPVFTGTKVIGDNNQVTGTPRPSGANAAQYVVGDYNTLTDTDASNIYGSSNTVNKSDVVVVGASNTVKNSYGNILGDYNHVDSVSYGSVNVVGINSSSIGINNNIIGSTSSVTGNKSSILGNNASVTANSSVSIGEGSSNTRDNTISFGSSGAERQLTNVTAGTADTDAINLKQMNDADASTLSSAKGYTDARETVINSRMDTMMAQEKSDRIIGDADTLAKSGDYTDKQTAAAISTANSYTDSRESVINSRTDGLVADEASKRITGDAETLKSANTYTTSQVAGERDARIDGDRRTLSSANSYTNQKFHELDNKVNRNERRANGGISAAMAMSSIPYLNYVSSGLGVGTATYRGETSIAAGFQQQVNASTNVRLNMSWDTSDGVGVGAGFAVGW